MPTHNSSDFKLSAVKYYYLILKIIQSHVYLK